MKKLIGYLLMGLALNAAGTFAASPILTTASIPSSVEIVTTHSTSSSSHPEQTPHLIVYQGGTGFVAPYNTDKAKIWAEIAKTAFATGKKLRIYYEPDFVVSLGLCNDYNSSGNCIVALTFGQFYRIERISLQ